MSCECPLAFNPRVGTESESTAINERAGFMSQSQWALANYWNFGAITRRQFHIY